MIRTLFIGLDGATFTLLDDLTRDTPDKPAVMPFLGRLYSEGVRGTLFSTPNPLTPPAWMSLMTGKSPGQHGIFDFIRAEENGEDVFFTLYDARDSRAETIWSIAGRQGRRVAALNFPFTAPPPENLNGFLVPGFVPWRHLRRNTRPDDFYDRLKEVPGFNPKELAWDFEQEKKALDDVLTGEEREQWVRYHLPREKQWFRIAEYLVHREAPDLMAVMFDGVDKLQHQAWLFLDPALQTGELSDDHRRTRQLCLDYFRQLDRFLEQLVVAAGPQAQVFLASDHGFTATSEIVRINAWLEQKGYLKWKRMPDSAEAARREGSMFANLDWKHTTAYCRTPSSNGITIRVAKNPGDAGVPLHDYAAFREQLIRDLEDLRDPSTQERIIAGIDKREDVFPGPAMNEAPDLLLRLRDCGFVSIKNRKPVVEQRRETAGTHHPEGVFFGWGPGIRRGAVIPAQRVFDIGSLLLYSLGLEVPADFEGRVSESIFTREHLRERPIMRGTSTDRAACASGTERMAEAEQEQVMAQLQMLGYME